MKVCLGEVPQNQLKKVVVLEARGDAHVRREVL